MEDAANILGAGTLRTTCASRCRWCCRRSSAALIISFLEAIALFGAPALIALPARFNVVSTQLWQFFEYPVRVEVAAAYAMPLLLHHRADVLAAAPVLGRSGYIAVTGKGGERRMIALGLWRWVMLGYALFGLRAVGVPADAGAAAGRVRQGLGPRLLARQSDAQQFPLSAVRADAGAATRSSTPSSMPASRRSPRSAWRWRSPMSSTASWCRSATCSPSCAWRRS